MRPFYFILNFFDKLLSNKHGVCFSQNRKNDNSIQFWTASLENQLLPLEITDVPSAALYGSRNLCFGDVNQSCSPSYSSRTARGSVHQLFLERGWSHPFNLSDSWSIMQGSSLMLMKEARFLNVSTNLAGSIPGKSCKHLPSLLPPQFGKTKQNRDKFSAHDDVCG